MEFAQNPSRERRKSGAEQYNRAGSNRVREHPNPRQEASKGKGMNNEERSKHNQRVNRLGRDTEECPACKGRHSYTGSNGRTMVLTRLAGCMGFDRLTNMMKSKMITKVSGCRVCTSWRYTTFKCNTSSQRRRSTGRRESASSPSRQSGSGRMVEWYMI